MQELEKINRKQNEYESLKTKISQQKIIIEKKKKIKLVKKN
jgi:hypothetical protein